jgi:hypothetical protein
MAEPVHKWFDDEDDENLWVNTDIIDIITMHLKEVKRFHTPCAFKAFTDLTALCSISSFGNDTDAIHSAHTLACRQVLPL